MDRYQQLQELRQQWKAPAELNRSIPREVQLKAAGYAVAVLSGLLVLGGIAGGVLLQIGSDRQAREQAVLERDGMDADAQVTRLWRSSDKEQAPMATYRFDAGGRIYSKSVKVPRQVWNTLASGSTLPVRFLPSDPSISHPREWSADRTPIWVPPMIGVSMAGLSLVLVLRLKRQRRLLSEGRPAPGIVTRYSHADKGRKRIHYEFAPMHSSVIEGKSGPMRRQTMPAIGATVCVLYDPDNPRRNTPYPMDLVRILE